MAAHLVIVATLGNGVPLPRAQGYPARVVAEDVFGGRWVKYLERDLSAVAKPGGPGASASSFTPSFSRSSSSPPAATAWSRCRLSVVCRRSPGIRRRLPSRSPGAATL